MIKKILEGLYKEFFVHALFDYSYREKEINQALSQIQESMLSKKESRLVIFKWAVYNNQSLTDNDIDGINEAIHKAQEEKLRVVK